MNAKIMVVLTALTQYLTETETDYLTFLSYLATSFVIVNIHMNLRKGTTGDAIDSHARAEILNGPLYFQQDPLARGASRPYPLGFTGYPSFMDKIPYSVLPP